MVRVFGPKIRTNLVRSGIPDHRTGPKIGWSGFPDHRTGPRLIGPEFRTIGPDQLYLVRNSGPPDRTNFTWSGIPDHRTGPKLNWSGIPDHGPDQIRTGGPDIHAPMFDTVDINSSTCTEELKIQPSQYRRISKAWTLTAK